MNRSAVISETKRKIREVNPGNIPDFLKQVPRWVVWKAFDHDNGGRFSKIPIHPKLGFKISFQSKKNHLRFDDALEGYSKGLGDGIGIVLTDAPISTADQLSPKYLIGVDLDNVCESDEKRFQAKKLCKSIGSYCEISPSGTGIRIFALSEVPLGRGQSPKGEMYNNNRFLTVTGNGKKRSVRIYNKGKLMNVTQWLKSGQLCPDTNFKDGNGIWVQRPPDLTLSGMRIKKFLYRNGEHVENLEL